MSDNKKYYYLKLKENFFDSDSMIIMESMPDGYKYSNILLKLYLRSLKQEGKLMFNERIPYNSTILSQVTRHSVGDVEKAVKVFRELGLIEMLDNGAIFITDIQNFIGTSSTEADRIREYRSRIAQEKQALLPTSTNERTNVQQTYDESTPEIELELETDINIEIEEEEPAASVPYQMIIEYLNEKTGKKFSHKSAANQKLIKARWNEGYKVDDFMKVIDTKVAHWLHTTFKDGTPGKEYLRPATLFSGSFDKYLNEEPAGKEKQVLKAKEKSYGGIKF
ncbi:phage replisome organizer N-terminal domain-containing protein [Jeotgalibaca porci]|uniref:phage replisome organizer N-terminal domain-containing protein n=1 Tax=Jeotgalibaca porci TaxID=1868793 RepID=UPI0035A0A45B